MSGSLRYTPQSGGHSRRAAQSAARQESPTSKPPVKSAETIEKLSMQRNVEPVLSLGATRYASIGRLGTFCCPPVPFPLGQKGMDLYVNMMNAAREVMVNGRPEAQRSYYRYMRQMAKLLHSHVRPVGFVRRKLWRMGLTRNQFLSCSEQELKHIADFFLHGRMKSSVQYISEPEEQQA